MRRFLAGVPVVAAIGCHPGAIETLSDAELVITRFDPARYGEDADRRLDFATYARPDIVVPLDPDDEDPIDRPEPPPLNDEIWAAIDRNLQALGYERLTGDRAPEADAVVLAGTVAENWVAWTCYPGWNHWGWWSGWGAGAGPGLDWCYPGTSAIGTFESGTLLVDLVDVRDIPDDDLEAAWSALVTGLLASTEEGVRRQIDRTVDRAFAQSSYLRVEDVR